MNSDDLSREISIALRHEPAKYGLVLDEEGWVDISVLVKSLRDIPRFSQLTMEDIVTMIASSEKKRHEVSCGKIRARYGHSVSGRIAYDHSVPPDILYHGTANEFIESIFEYGLVSKSRQYVHLSESISMAKSVGKRRDIDPAILRIDAASAHRDGVMFYFAGDGIWLADTILPVYIKMG